MSSETFRYRVVRVEGRDVVLEIKPTAAAGLCDLASSRSFVLLLLREQAGAPPLAKAKDPRWLAAHLDEYVTRVTPEALTGLTFEPLLRDFSEQWCVPAEHLQPRLTLRATLASKALAAKFRVGSGGGTSAFDVWLDDPAYVPLSLGSTVPEAFDPQPELETRVVEALVGRLRGWEREASTSLFRQGADAQLRLIAWPGPPRGARSSVELVLWIAVPAFETLPAPKKAPYGRTGLLRGHLTRAPGGSHLWFRRYAHEPDRERFEYSADDAPLESLEAMVDRAARTIEAVDVDALLHRDALRGLMEHGATLWPRKKGEPAPTAIGRWAAPTIPATWQWGWKPNAYLPESIWTRVALHAVFGTRAEARKALAQARALSKKPPTVLKPMIASLDKG